MGRSDDSIARRRNKLSRKKQEMKSDSSSKVSNRVAAIIAAKKRRQSGKRRMCQGMCFSLPTPEDPFNERQGKPEQTRKRKRKSKVTKKTANKNGSRLKEEASYDSDAPEDLQELKVREYEKVEIGRLAFSSFRFMGPEIAINLGKPTYQTLNWEDSKYSWKEGSSESIANCPSKFLTMCLNCIEDALQNGGALNGEGDKPLFVNAWGLKFWDCYCSGKDVLETDRTNSTAEQIAWIAATIANSIAVKDKEGLSIRGSSLLHLVPSKDRALEVRQVYKPLKALGVHTVSLHSGASIDHQITGLKSYEPEFLVATPGRLLELLSLKAVDISGVSLLVIDGLKSPFEGTYFDSVKSIRQSITENIRSVVFCDCTNNLLARTVQQLL